MENKDQKSTPQQPQNPAPRFDPNSIYPIASSDPQLSNLPSPLGENKITATKSLSFGAGYSIGGTIFWFQLLAAIVLGLIFYGITVSALKSTSLALLITASIVYYVIEFCIILYIPYSILKSSLVESAFWLALFGAAIQTTIIVSLLIVIEKILIQLILRDGSTISLTQISGSEIKATAIVIYIVALIAGYFLTKVAYGLALLAYAKINNKVIIRIIGLAIIALVVGGIVYHYLAFYHTKKHYVQKSSPIPQQMLGSSVFSDPVTGYKLTLPAGWSGGEVPANTVDGVKTTSAWWYYSNNIIDQLSVDTTSPSNASLQSVAFNWSSSKQMSNTDYKLISSNETTINGTIAYYITDSWVTKTITPLSISDQVVLEEFGGTLFTVQGYSYTQYYSSFSNALKGSLFSFKP